MRGKLVKRIERTILIIGQDGRIQKIFPKA
jgi:peroxiredoxin